MPSHSHLTIAVANAAFISPDHRTFHIVTRMHRWTGTDGHELCKFQARLYAPDVAQSQKLWLLCTGGVCDSVAQSLQELLVRVSDIVCAVETRDIGGRIGALELVGENSGLPQVWQESMHCESVLQTHI